MSAITMQRDLVLTLKKETMFNIWTLSKLYPMSVELNRQIMKEDSLEKLTQNLFNNLSHYLVSLIDPQISASFSWPLYDSKTERAYRNEFSKFILDYSNKGLLSPVMSSYLVNPSCYKVTFLTFQLTGLAVERVLKVHMKKSNQKQLFNKMTSIYKEQTLDFIELISKETDVVLSKFSNYIYKKEIIEKMAITLINKIDTMETELELLKAQEFLNDIIGNYIKSKTSKSSIDHEIVKISDVYKDSLIFELWLQHTDTYINNMQINWNEKFSAFFAKSLTAYNNSKTLISRQTGEIDKITYILMFNQNKDLIDTNELEDQVNSEQKFILKNLLKDSKQVFPNLIRSFVIAISYLIKDMEIGDDIYKFNEYLETGQQSLSEIVIAMKVVMERLLTADSQLQMFSPSFIESITIDEFPEIPPLPDMSDLKFSKTIQFGQVMCEKFTPLNITKGQFNLKRKHSNSSFASQPKSFFLPSSHLVKDDLMKSFINCEISGYDGNNLANNFHNLSVIPKQSRANETISECTGFSKQQIQRLLSVKKSSSSKKYKYKLERPDIKVKKGGLFNESTSSIESVGLLRSHSSPNLYERRENKFFPKGKSRKLSIMKESSPCSILEVSGIVVLEDDCSTPQELNNQQPKDPICSIPVITVVKPDTEEKLNINFNEFDNELHLAKTNELIQLSNEKQSVLKPHRSSNESSLSNDDNKLNTPQSNQGSVKKTSSLEKIITRFKKVRATKHTNDISIVNDFKTILEEKENVHPVNIDVFTANKVLLPDLLSPSCSLLSVKTNNFIELSSFDLDNVDMDLKRTRKPRESLGTALGVDETFLDQFDLID